MPLMGDTKKAGSVALIIKKMRGGDSYDNMRHENDRMSETMSNEHGDELDVSSAIDSASEGLILAVERKDPKGVKRALKSFIEIYMMEMEHDNHEEDRY